MSQAKRLTNTDQISSQLPFIFLFLRPGGEAISHRRQHVMSVGKMGCPGAGCCPLGTRPGPCPQVTLLRPQMTLVLQVPRLDSEGLALVPWVRLLVPMLKELLRATGRRGSSRRCHCRHFF